MKSSLLIFLVHTLSTYTQALQYLECSTTILYLYSECYITFANITDVTKPIEILAEYSFGRSGENITTLRTSDSYAFKTDIHYLHPQIFEEFPNLVNIHLYSTKLKSIELNYCEKLDYLSLKNTEIEEIPNEVFKNCTNLTYLSLDIGIVEKVYENSFRGLKNLANLIIRDQKFVEIFNSSLIDCENLETFYFNGNGSIATGALKHLKKLRSLQLIKYSSDFSHIEELLNNHSKLDFITLSENSLENINFEFFKKFKNLSSLSLSQNKLMTIPAGSFDGLENLKILNLAYNHITILHEDSFKGLINLDRIFLNENYISDFSTFFLNPLTSLNYLDLSGNKFPTVPNGFFDNNQKLETLYLKNCRIAFINPGIFNTLSSLEYLNLDKNDIKVLQSETFVNLTNLTTIIFDNNQIRRLNTNSFVNLEKMNSFYIQNNFLDEIEPNFLDNFPNLRFFHTFGNICINETLLNNNDLINDDEILSECHYNWQFGRTTTTTSTQSTTTNDAANLFFVPSVGFLDYLHYKSLARLTKPLEFKLINPILKELKFLIYIQSINNFNELNDLINKENTNQMNMLATDIRFFEYFMGDNDDFVFLSANQIYSEKECGKFQLRNLNIFDIESQKWRTPLENFDLYENFHGCFIPFVISYDLLIYIEELAKEYVKTPNYDLYKTLVSKTYQYKGLMAETINIAAKKFNFTQHYTWKLRPSSSFHYSDSHKFTAFWHKAIMPGFADMINYTTGLHWSKPINSIDFYYLVTLNDLYNNYEKLLMPFDELTWILLCLTIGLTFLIIFGSYRAPLWMRKIIYGEGIHNPAYNALGIMFGISQLRLPKESGNRLMLALFLWFCLIFRTCYQSMLFEFMTSDMRKPLPVSIEDLIKYNYTIILLYSQNLPQINLEIINGRQIPKNKTLKYSELISLYNKSLNGESEEKYAFLISALTHTEFNYTFSKTLTVMDNERITKKNYLVMNSNNPFMIPLNYAIQKLSTSGISEYLEKYSIWLHYRPLVLEILDPRKVLSLSDLGFEFVIWLISLSFLITCFLIEISIGFYRKIRRTIEELEVFAITKIIEVILEILMKNFNGRI
ncbi:hypothetical protein PVAND_014989 [Polypedilum vanderplanki]|uniref:Uncharacterized protein n=1 Tax=Polypedilum vanderplanki TaxID=319348 RepID=A0A9J6BBB3_POLVA|nr:hypothetical protein PVAND_014989 [Polypedilum vanderplanki]